MYFLLTLLVAVTTSYIDFLLLTNFKASVLIVVSTILVIFLNYIITISAIGDTSLNHRTYIFGNLKWYTDEMTIAFSFFLIATCFVVAITFVWYIPKQYSINVLGLTIVLLFVPITSIISGVLGTKRGLQKYAA